jgi:exosome complex exonuclease RRP6
MDTKWLQRDFNIHIVNLFDTHKASRVLGKPKFSYAFLLDHYCTVQTNKIYQLADWR